MEEAFGVVTSAVGIAAAFSSCIDCFDYAQQAPYFGRDFETNFLTLDCARLRLTRWGKAVNVYGDPNLASSEVLSGDVQHAKEIFDHILELFVKT
jgi:hypothetical protein